MNTQPFGLVFPYELSGCGFESRCSHLRLETLKYTYECFKMKTSIPDPKTHDGEHFASLRKSLAMFGV